MKKILLGTLALVFMTGTVHAYTSGQADPLSGIRSLDAEYRTVVKSTTAGFSDAILIGDILSYDTNNVQDGYTVTRVGENSVVGAARNACIAVQAIATGDIGEHRCLSKGIAPYASFSAVSKSFVIGQKLCANTSGQAVVCAACDQLQGTNDCQLGTATGNSVITPLVTEGTGQQGIGYTTGVRVLINSK